ncbi:protein FAM81B isoform X3 [Fukomys damarensis]|uniref:protein FAM81B isoform X3 n=1 Tax=Fukomys damarensis TaxID=885580 RepID=UPI001455AEB6|nr:protein FAM81B isoform X3 [Fukomys damarensis]
MSSDTDVNKSASPPAGAQPEEPDGPLPGTAGDQEKKVRLSPAKMSTKNSTDLVEYVDKGRPFLPVIAKTQTSQLEDRLNLQERTTAFLLEQAFRIKEDISACLQGSHGFRKEESLARKLLESHIQTITSIVKKLSQNIEILEDQIKARDQTATGTNFAVQDLNIKHLQGVGDLRGRVARFNSLSSNVYEEVENNQKWTGNQFLKHRQDLLAHINECLKALQEKLEKSTDRTEGKMMQLSSKLENFINSQKQGAELNKVKHIENKLSKKMNQMEKQIWGELEKMQNEYQSGFQSIHDSLNSLQQIQKTKMDLEKYKVQKDIKKLQRKIVELREI